MAVGPYLPTIPTSQLSRPASRPTSHPNSRLFLTARQYRTGTAQYQWTSRPRQPTRPDIQTLRHRTVAAQTPWSSRPWQPSRPTNRKPADCSDTVGYSMDSMSTIQPLGLPYDIHQPAVPKPAARATQDRQPTVQPTGLPTKIIFTNHPISFHTSWVYAGKLFPTVIHCQLNVQGTARPCSLAKTLYGYQTDSTVNLLNGAS